MVKRTKTRRWSPNFIQNSLEIMRATARDLTERDLESLTEDSLSLVINRAIPTAINASQKEGTEELRDECRFVVATLLSKWPQDEDILDDIKHQLKDIEKDMRRAANPQAASDEIEKIREIVENPTRELQFMRMKRGTPPAGTTL